MSDDFGIRFGTKFVSFRDELMLQLEIVLDNSIVDDDDFTRAIAVRMRIFFRGTAVRGPACVPKPVHALDRRFCE